MGGKGSGRKADKLSQVFAQRAVIASIQDENLELPNRSGKTETFSGRVKKTFRTISSYNITGEDDIIFMNTDNEVLTVTLPIGREGQTFKIINSGNNQLIITPNGTEDLLGSNTTFTLISAETMILTYNSTDGWY